MGETAGQEHGSRIIAALEAAWAAIQARHPEAPGVVIVTGAGSSQRGVPRGYRLRGHHWPARRITGTTGDRDGELFIAGELLAAEGRAVVEVMLHEAAHALAAVRAIKDASAEGNRYHNKRFVAMAEELGLRGAIDAGRLPYLPDGPPGTGKDGQGEDGGAGSSDQGDGKPTKRGGRRVAVECACQPMPRKLHLTPRQIADGPVICGLCSAPCGAPEGDEDQGDEGQ